MELHLHWSHDLLLPCEPISARRARVFARSALEQHGLERLAHEIEIVVSELASNAIVHARTPFSLTVAGDTVVVLVSVRDRSSAPPARAHSLVHADSSRPRLGGRGLALVDHFSSEWGTNFDRSGGTKAVWATFRTT